METLCTHHALVGAIAAKTTEADLSLGREITDPNQGDSGLFSLFGGYELDYADSSDS